MPKGVYDRHAAQPRTTKQDVMEFMAFCFREDIAEQLAKVKKPHQLAVQLYFDETGKTITSQCAYKQRGKWIEINGKICRTA